MARTAKKQKPEPAKKRPAAKIPEPEPKPEPKPERKVYWMKRGAEHIYFRFEITGDRARIVKSLANAIGLGEPQEMDIEKARDWWRYLKTQGYVEHKKGDV